MLTCNLGVGTSSPGEKLDVAGRGRFTTPIDTAITVTSTDPVTGIQFTDNNGTSQLFYVGSTDTFYFDTSANVAIGTNTAAEKLEVSGSVYVNAENSGFIVDAGGNQRVGLMKYAGEEGVLQE